MRMNGVGIRRTGCAGLRCGNDKIGLETGGPTRRELPAFVKSQIASWAVAARDAVIQKQ